MAPLPSPITILSSSGLTARNTSANDGSSPSTLSFLIPIIAILSAFCLALCFFACRRLYHRNRQPNAANRDVPLYGGWGFKSKHRPADGSDNELPAYTPTGREHGRHGEAQVVGAAGTDLGTVQAPPPVYSATPGT